MLKEIENSNYIIVMEINENRGSYKTMTFINESNLDIFLVMM